MSTKFFVDVVGNYLGGFDGAEPPVGAIEVPGPPSDARQMWDGAAWEAVPALDPLTLPMDRLTFWLVAADVGVNKWRIRDRIAEMPESLEKREAIAWFDEAERYRRYDPILLLQAGAEGLTPTELDHLWLWGLQATP